MLTMSAALIPSAISGGATRSPSAALDHSTAAATGKSAAAAVSGGPFTVVTPVPAVTSVSPDSGPKAGGTTVTITGTGFTGVTKVAFGAAVAASYVVDSDTEITAVSPAERAGVKNVFVTTRARRKKSAAVSGDRFTFFTPGPVVPAVTSVSPVSGPEAGGTTVTVTGTGFTGATEVAFGATNAASYVVDSDTQITAVSDRKSVV